MRCSRPGAAALALALAGLVGGCTGPGGAMAPSWNAFWHDPDYAIVKPAAGGPPPGYGRAPAASPLPYGVSPGLGGLLFGRI